MHDSAGIDAKMYTMHLHVSVIQGFRNPLACMVFCFASMFVQANLSVRNGGQQQSSMHAGRQVLCLSVQSCFIL